MLGLILSMFTLFTATNCCSTAFADKYSSLNLTRNAVASAKLRHRIRMLSIRIQFNVAH